MRYPWFLALAALLPLPARAAAPPPRPATALVKPRMSFAEASRPYEGLKYSLSGWVGRDGKVRGGGLGCSAYTSVVLHRMRDGAAWLGRYNIKVHQWYGDRSARYFDLSKAGTFPASDLLEAARTQALLRDGVLRPGTLYYFNARKGKSGHVGFVRLKADGGLEQRQYSSLAKGLYKGDFRVWLRRSMYRSATVELYVVPEPR
jgi:hypothetical protein